MKYFLTFLFCVVQISCTAQEKFGPISGGNDENQISEIINVSSAYINPPMAGRNIASAYMSIQNLSNNKVNLISITSPVSQTIEIHNHIHDGKIMRMRKLNNLNIMAGETVELAQGGLHLMLFEANLSNHLNGIPLLLNFENLPSIEITAIIKKETIN